MMLTDLADACRKSGLDVVEVDGWRNRSRPASSGGFNPRGVLCHHTGGFGDGRKYADWLALTGRADLPAPLCQLTLDRQGCVYVLAAGRANHAGKAKAQGTLPAGDGNELYLGIEAMNSGSEGWDDVQYDAYVRLVAALVEHYGWPVANVRGHKETSVTGKVDPAFDMREFREDVIMAQVAARTPAPKRRPKPVRTALKAARIAYAAAKGETQRKRIKRALDALREVNPR